MNADELRARQAPLKQCYREAPEAAAIRARAEAKLDDDAVACRIATTAGEVVAGLHPATGGDGTEACSADMLLQALVACAGVTARAVATASGITLGGRILAEAVWDARGTLGIDREAPIGLSEIALTFELTSDAPPERLGKLIATVERYCVILQTLRDPPRVTVRAPVAAAT
ncbi:MAG: OsmC family protein [Acidisphaera sp.]|nr:OsmC family protein [Acidisphaera sp.]MBV9812882.1 OsmC family protein [Acetobacteraceae bacterium]